MRILITGGLGQLGRALQEKLADHEVTIVDLPDVDITDRHSTEATIIGSHPQVVIHCAAYTDVDGCTRDPDLAFRVNGLGTQNVALACRAAGSIMVHISTNEVFSGDKPGGYEEWMSPDPINTYGRSKAAAEFHVRSIMDRWYIVRTAWLFAPGGRNFIHAILDRADSVGHLQVVTDEIGNPTYAPDLARAISVLIGSDQYGVYHFTNSGSCSRWAFANQILKLAGLESIPNYPILSVQYKRVSTPPPFGVLHNIVGAAIGIRLRPWQEALAQYMAEHAA